MYQWINENKDTLWNAVFSKYCKYKWTIIKYTKVNGKWTETDTYKRFHTLEEARKYAFEDLKK